MRRSRSWPKFLVTAGVVVAVMGMGSHAQDGMKPLAPAKPTVEVALVSPLSLPFAEGVSLEDLAKYLSTAVKAPVVLDLAALKRLEISPESVVKLNVEGIRLKTGLKLLLDQVEMSYRVVPEDNLLILTDAEGAEDSSSRILAELKTIRQDIAGLKTTLDTLNVQFVPVDEEAPAIRKPTIIEEMPDANAPAPRSRPGL